MSKLTKLNRYLRAFNTLVLTKRIAAPGHGD